MLSVGTNQNCHVGIDAHFFPHLLRSRLRSTSPPRRCVQRLSRRCGAAGAGRQAAAGEALRAAVGVALRAADCAARMPTASTQPPRRYPSPRCRASPHSFATAAHGPWRGRQRFVMMGCPMHCQCCCAHGRAMCLSHGTSRREGSRSSRQSAEVARHLNLRGAGRPRRRRRSALGPRRRADGRRRCGWRGSPQRRPASRRLAGPIVGPMLKAGPVAMVLLTLG